MPFPSGSAVAHGGNPHRPWRLPLGEDRAASPKSKISMCLPAIYLIRFYLPMSKYLQIPLVRRLDSAASGA